MKSIPEAAKSRIISLLQAGHSIREVAKITGISRSTIGSIRKITSFPSSEKKIGRPRILEARQERLVARMVSSGQWRDAEKAKSHLKQDYNIEISAESLRRSLRRSGLQAHICPKKPLLRKKHRQERLAFARRYKNWTMEDWKKVIWSDETKFNVFGSGGRQHYWKKPGASLQSHHVKPIVKHGGGSIMLWGCITAQGVGYMCRINDSMDASLYQSILKGELLDTFAWYGFERGSMFFQHDNDPKHTANSTKSTLQELGINVLEWPSQSPDLNSIEHVWNELDKRVRNLEVLPRNRDELWEAIETQWNLLGAEFCLKLINTMPERIKDVLKAKGGNTTW